MFGKPESELTLVDKARLFFGVHYRGAVCIFAPLILIGVLAPFPPQPLNWCAYTMALMAVFWISECIPLEITSFMPVLIFPLTGVMTTAEVCKAYINDIVLMLLGALFLAYALEHSGILNRFAYFAISKGGKSHVVMLLCMSLVTHFISMWIPNTAATSVMVPVVFSVLNMFERQGLIKIYETGPNGEKKASDLTTCYFCSVSYAATFGGVATLVGTATNMAFKGLFQTTYPTAPDELTFLKFIAFAFGISILLEFMTFVYMIILYLGVLRKGSEAAKKSEITKKGGDAVSKALVDERKKLGKFSCWEGMALALYIIAMLALLLRNPGYFPGWGGMIHTSFSITDNLYVRDSAAVMCACLIMFLLPSALDFIRNFRVKVYEELPKTRTRSVLHWPALNSAMPFSFMFLLGGGFALCEGAKISGLSDKIGESFKALKALPALAAILIIIIVAVIITNIASNVVVANLMCPIAMRLAKEMGVNPLWYCIASGIAASYCFILPIGTPGNLIVYRAANISIKKMMIAGVGPTIFAIAVTWIMVTFLAPILFPGMESLPTWAQ